MQCEVVVKCSGKNNMQNKGVYELDIHFFFFQQGAKEDL